MKKNLNKKTKLKIIKLKNIKMEKGNLVKFIEKKSLNYKGFGEVYFSSAYSGVIKGWHLHQKQTQKKFRRATPTAHFLEVWNFLKS